MEHTFPGTEQTSFIIPLFRHLHARQRELGLSNETLMKMTAISHTTFYRIWKEGEVDLHMDFYYIEKFCAALQVELKFQAYGTEPMPEVSRTAQAEVAENTAELLAERRQEIENLDGRIAHLTEELAAKQTELDALRTEHLRLALSVSETLKSAQDQSNEIIRGLLSRIEDLQSEVLHNFRSEK